MPIAAETFEYIISRQTTKELVPFLLTLSTQEVQQVRLKTLDFLKHGIPNPRPREVRGGWTIYPPLAAVPALKALAAQPASPSPTFFVDPAKEESALFFLTGLATYTRKDAFGDGFHWWGSLAHDFFSSRREEVRVVLAHAKPTWLTDWVMSNGNSLADYWVLRGLEDDGFIEYRPQHFAFRLAWLALYQNHVSLQEQLARDKLALTRDLPNQFEFELSIARLDGTSAANYEKFTWLRVLVGLVATHHLSRADILTRCLLALRRDFRRPLLTWFRELFLALKPTFTERLARQGALTELLTHPQALVVSFALNQLKDMHPEPGFDLAPFLVATEPILIRPDLKTSLRALVAGLAKLPYRVPAHAPAVALLLTTALAHPDATVQERAAKGLAGLLAAKKPLLTPAETTAALATLARQAELLGAPARTALAPWLAPPTAAAPATALAGYAPHPQFVPDISPTTAIAPVADWHELLFLTGQVLQHDEPAAQERWLDGLLRLHGQLPVGAAAQLQPYLGQAFPQLKKASPAEASAVLAGPFALHGHNGLLRALLLGWAGGFGTPRVAGVQVNQGHGAPIPLLALAQQRYLLAETHLRSANALPLLSTPTHHPHWVAPSLLVTKLLAYQAAGIAPTAPDLAVALARAAHAHPAEAAAARRLLPQLADIGLRELLTWFLGPPSQPLPALAPAAGRAPAQLDTNLAAALPELWAVAARTKAPAAAFPTLAASLGYDYAGLTQPLPTSCEAVPRENRYPDPTQPGQEAVYRFVELSWRSGAATPAPSPLLLYAPPVGASQYGSWQDNWLLASGLPHFFSLLPNYPAPLYAHVLRCAAWADNLESSERDLLLRALTALLGPGPVLEAAATAVLASGLLHHSPPGRSLAQEVLLRAIGHGRLRPDALGQVLGQQLATGYAPAARLADNLLPLRGIDARTDDALRQVLAAILPALPAAPPRNTRKLLDAYAALLGYPRPPVPAPVQARLRAWQAITSLRTGSKALLAHDAA